MVIYRYMFSLALICPFQLVFGCEQHRCSFKNFKNVMFTTSALLWLGRPHAVLQLHRSWAKTVLCGETRAMSPKAVVMVDQSSWTTNQNAVVEQRFFSRM